MSGLGFHEIKKGRLILQALQKYGVMSKRTLKEVLPEYKSLKRLECSIKNLYERKLIVKRYDQINDQKSVFYQISQLPFAREVVAVLLNTTPEKLIQPVVSYKEIFHEQVVIKIAYKLSLEFPEATILREDELVNHPMAEKIISGLHTLDSVKPDLLLILNPNEVYPTSIAIEYERSYKTRNRVSHKLHFYTQKTKVDGVLYFYPSSMIDHNVRHAYYDKVLKGSLRVRDYGNNFLLTSELKNDIGLSLQNLKNANKNYYSIQHWLHVLTEHPESKRLNKYF